MVIGDKSMIIKQEQIEAIVKELEGMKDRFDNRPELLNSVRSDYVAAAAYGYCIDQLKGLLLDGKDQLSR